MRARARFARLATAIMHPDERPCATIRALELAHSGVRKEVSKPLGRAGVNDKLDVPMVSVACIGDPFLKIGILVSQRIVHNVDRLLPLLWSFWVLAIAVLARGVLSAKRPSGLTICGFLRIPLDG